MKNGEYVIRFKGTDMFFSAGGYHGPAFAGFLDAWPYASEEAARVAAECMRIGKPHEGATLQIMRVANLPDIFDPENGMVAKLTETMDKLRELEGMVVLAQLRSLREFESTIHDARIALAQQGIALGANLAGDNVVAEVVPEYSM